MDARSQAKYRKPSWSPAELIVIELLMKARRERPVAPELDFRVQRGDVTLDEVLAHLPAMATDVDATLAVLDALGQAARRLGKDGLTPEDQTAAAAFALIATVADRLAGSGVFPIGRPSFLSDELLRLLCEEAREQLDPEPPSTRRTTRPAGDVLGHVAVSRQLREACSAATGTAIVPTFDALYEYDGPDSHVRTHLDGSGYPWTCHVLVEHRRLGTNTPAASVLIAHVPGRGTRRYILHDGDAVVLRGRGTLHSWAPLGPDERRVLIAVGFRDAADSPAPGASRD